MSMKESDYLKRVHLEKCTPIDYGKWIKFDDSFPPVFSKKPWQGTIIEILLEDGRAIFESVFRTDTGEIRFHDIDISREFLEWQLPEYFELYWRFVPDPPGNFGYSA